jgi:2-oxoglutarate ferredoxin oxidoreductase subunit beta
MFNNQVYGLTKGQFSPTSPIGQVTKTSPDGVNMSPVNPLLFALAAGATFVARGLDKDPNHLAALIVQAHAHPGISFIEIYQDCNVFNHGAFDNFAAKPERAKNTLVLENQKPMLFGEQNEKSLVLLDDQIAIQDNKNPIIHNTNDYMMAIRLAKLQFPHHPVPIGVIYQNSNASIMQYKTNISKTKDDLVDLYRGKNSWQIP